MKKLYLFLLSIIFIFALSNRSFAQVGGMVGTDIFFNGRFLEIGQQTNGDFGVVTAAAGYHTHCAGCVSTTALAEVYDYGHDGWATGAPAFMGDYTFPGSPFEGWELQVNGARTQAFCTGGAAAYTGGLGMTGNNVSYADVGGKLIGNWAGTAGGLTISQQTRVDTSASWVVVTTIFRNPTAATVSNVYYMRSCDPDNDETWPGGSFATNNSISFQNDVDHRVGVTAIGQSATAPPLTLCTKDCRAVCLIYGAWPLTSGQGYLATLWNQTYAGGFYTLHGNDNGDIAIALVYNIGNITAGDSAVISYAYVFDGANGIDSAFPEPTLVVNNVNIPPVGPAPEPTFDTFNACLYPGMTTLPVDIIYGGDKCWTWSTWTWSPATGLASTTGLTNTISLTALPPSITYTITGTDSSVDMYSCNHRVFYLTIHTCNGAVCNSPCLGDPLIFNAPGDSTGATYTWLGPNSWTTTVATTQSFTISPSVWADTGTYHVIKTVAGTSDTSTTIAIIHPKPSVTASSNSPLCVGAANTLTLFATPGTVPVTTYGWTGPAGFISAIQNPTIPGFTTPDTGIYTVIVATTFGCKDTATTDVQLLPPPLAPIVTDPNPYCQGDVFIPFTITGVTGTVYWYPSAAGGAGTTTSPVVNTAVPGTYTYYFGQTIGLCQSPIDSIKIVVNPLPAIPVVTSNSPICADSLLKLFATDVTPGVAYNWSGPTFTSALQNPTIPNAQAYNSGTYNVVVTNVTTGCHSSGSTTVVIKPTPAAPTVTANNPCDSFFILNLTANTSAGSTYSWTGPAGFASTLQNPSISPAILGVNDGTYTVTANLNGCPSLPATVVAAIRPNPAPPITRDSSYCQGSPTAPLTYQVDSAAASYLNWYNNPTGGVALGAAPFVQNSTVTYPLGTTWYVSQTVNGCESHRSPITDTIVYQPNFTIIASKTWVCDHDTLSFAYNSFTPLVSGSYQWNLPPGATVVGGSLTGPSVIVRFDSVYGPHLVSLTVGELNNMCSTTESVNITVIALPTVHCYMNPNICLGDTVGLAISDESSDASIFTWLIDGTPLGSSTEINIVAANSNSGGPFSISWNDSGTHFITVSCTTNEGCKSEPTNDTVDVHPVPNATFTFAPKATGTLCLEDSVLFTANYINDNCSYLWQPEHSFNNDNKPVIWGKVEESKSDIILTVTDPFGCKASWTQEIDPNSCCTVLFPNAFTPNGDRHNDYFRPIFNGYHRFHAFRIVNRWGQTVFESANSNPEWDGNYNGVPQDMGVYYYYIKYDCGGNTIEEKGDCTLIR